MRNTKLFANKIIVLISIFIILLMQLFFIIPEASYAEKAGDVLIVRVQYFGESGNKIREKCRFTRSELEAMGTETHYYSNITSVGTVMSIAARGPKVLDIIENAGIDINSIQNFTFKTTDGYTRNFNIGNYLMATRYYYPNLSSKYERDNQDNMSLLDGATKGKDVVPAILALECGESKAPEIDAKDIPMNTNKAYRFCMGQSELNDGQKVDLVNDVSSVDSCHSIYGIDITLSGSPDDEGVDVDDENIIGNKDEKNIGSNNTKLINSNEKHNRNNKKMQEKQYLKTREIVLGNKIVDELQESATINSLNDVQPFSKETSVVVGVGAGSLFLLGLLVRILRTKSLF